MINSRQKGKRGERYFANHLKDVFPNARRNANEQSQKGGCDILECEPFNIEVKIGKQAQISKNRQWLTQVKEEGKTDNYDIVLIKPDYEEAYVLIPFGDFMDILKQMKREKII